MSPQELFEKHAALQLVQFARNIQGFIDAVDRGDIVDSRHSRMYLPELREHLRSIGTPEDEDLLLLYGLIVPGLFRGIEPPLAALLTERGGLSKPRLDEAAGQIARLREALDFGRRIFLNLEADTTSGFRSLLKIAQSAGAYDDHWIETHRTLLPDETNKLLSLAFNLVEGSATEKHLAENIFTSLVQFREEGLGAATGYLLEKELYWPGIIYRDAPPAIALRLIERLPYATDRPATIRLLIALAWTRGKIVLEAFSEWINSPPPWAKKVDSLKSIPLQAGWTIDETGKFVSLFSIVSHRISSESSSASDAIPIECRKPTNDDCPLCADKLVYLFDFSSVPEEFLGKITSKAPKRILCCLNCSAYTTVFSHCRKDGSALLHPRNKTHDFGGAGTKTNPVQRYLSKRHFPPFATATPFSLSDVSAFGGAPSFVQHPEYPRCPDCDRTMPFLAQFDNSSLCYEEGVYYTFWCSDCGVAAVNFQQT